MIVNLQPDGWEIIYHRAHALLAAQIAGHWDFSKQTYRLYETIAAISHHDNLEKEWEEGQLTEVGAPLDFTLEKASPIEKLRKHADEALYQGRWVAMLISMHLCFLNQEKAASDAALAKFLQEQRKKQAQWRAELDISSQEAETAYQYLRWCDRLSLILAQRQVPAQGRQLDITPGPDQKPYRIYQLESGDLGVIPWPFSGDHFTVQVDACYLSQLQFASNDELKKALLDAPRKSLAWCFKKPED